jgi:trehalose synthase
MPKTLKHVRVPPLAPERFNEVLSADQAAELGATITRARASLNGRAIWNVNSTMRGGGVAEMLGSLIAYSRGAGIDARWIVIRGEERFFALTKRLHNMLHGEPGDGGQLGEEEEHLYRGLCERRAIKLAELVRPEDIVLLHDPQTAGMVSHLKQTGATVIWRSHVGVDVANDLAREAWRFLLPFVEPADAYVFSREVFAWTGLEPSKISVIAPSIDAFSVKNQPMDDATVAAVLRCGGIEDGPCPKRPRFTRLDGTPARVDLRAEVIGGPIPTDAPVLLQVSRWDRLKDHSGVLRAFSEHVAPRTDAHLLLAGPDVNAVADDPEGAKVLREVIAVRDECDRGTRERVHLVSLPMRDPEENAAFVNALQRRAMVVAQKSLREGFGLTVTEAMWKGKPVVAGRIGGIQDQIEDWVSGVLIDPADLRAFGDAVVDLFEHPGEAVAMGERAREQVRASFLGPRQLGQYVELFERLLMHESHSTSEGVSTQAAR